MKRVDSLRKVYQQSSLFINTFYAFLDVPLAPIAEQQTHLFHHLLNYSDDRPTPKTYYIMTQSTTYTTVID